MATQSLTVVPARRDYKPKIVPVSMGELPFTCRPKRGSKNFSNWHVPPTDNYGLACDIGLEYAAHFAQYLKDNRGSPGILGWIVSDIDFKDESGAKGYWVGFFSYLERLILAQAQQTDVFADADRVKASYAEILARRTLETETGEE